MNMSRTLPAPARPQSSPKRAGALWADSARRDQPTLPLPVAVAAAVLFALILMYGIDSIRLQAVQDRTGIATKVQLLTPPPPLAVVKNMVKSQAKPSAPKILRTQPPQPQRPEVRPSPVLDIPKVPTVANPTSNLASATTPPPSHVPAAEAAGPAPAAVAPTIGVVCPGQIRPQMPAEASENGIEGVVVAKAWIQHGAVKEVTMVSGPKVFYAAVRAAMLQYRCEDTPDPVYAEQTFRFKALD